MIGVLIFAILFLFVYWSVLNIKWKKVLFLVFSIAFITFLSPVYAVYYLLLSGVVYLLSVSKRYYGAAITLLVINLCFYKYFSFLAGSFNTIFEDMAGFGFYGIKGILFPVGLSFATFRMIHFLVESRRGNIKDATFLEFSLYITFFPTFLAGPVERFPAFKRMSDNAYTFKLEDLNYGLWRICAGLFRKYIVADSILPVIMPVFQSPEDYSRGFVLLALYGAAIWLYMDFGGYCDMAIGVSRLFGYRIMENFNWPFLKKNIALYWRSWHISVYSWIRDYFYFPFFVYKGTPVKIYVGIFLTMMVFMLWHAPTAGFLVAGIYNGVGLIVWKAYQDIKDKHPVLKKLFDHKAFDPIATLITFTYVSLGIGLAFSGRDFSGISEIIRNIL